MGIGELPGENGPRRLALKTRVEPFLRASSESYLEEQGPESMRRLIVEPDGAWTESKGAREALPARQAVHERAQYGLYGYLLELRSARATNRRQRLTHPGLPPVDFTLDEAGRPIEAAYTVPSYADDSAIAQTFRFEGLAEDRGVAWPRRITILVDGKLNFRIVIDRFSVELA